MARGRMLSKVISLDEKVNALSDDTARLLFTWLIPHLDCEGRMYGDALTVKSIVFPRRSMPARKIEKYLKELEHYNLILRYFVDGNEFLAMQSFEKHQIGLHKSRESASQIPPVPQDLIRTNSGSCPSEDKEQVKEEVEEEVEEEGSSCLSNEVNKSTDLDPSEVYRNNIGEPTEAMETEIDLAVKMFSAPWVVDAIKEAVKQDKPSWSYIAGILKNWKRYGRSGTKARADPDKFIHGKYGKSVRR